MARAMIIFLVLACKLKLKGGGNYVTIIGYFIMQNLYMLPAMVIKYHFYIIQHPFQVFYSDELRFHIVFIAPSDKLKYC